MKTNTYAQRDDIGKRKYFESSHSAQALWKHPEPGALDHIPSPKEGSRRARLSPFHLSAAGKTVVTSLESSPSKAGVFSAFRASCKKFHLHIGSLNTLLHHRTTSEPLCRASRHLTLSCNPVHHTWHYVETVCSMFMLERQLVWKPKRCAARTRGKGQPFHDVRWFFRDIPKNALNRGSGIGIIVCHRDHFKGEIPV